MYKILISILSFIAISYSIVGCADPSNWKFTSASFANEGGKQTQQINLAIAKNNKERAQGLMFVKSMPSNAGMIFIFPDERERHFWMKNTYISLDIIFLDKNFSVVGIAPRTKTLSTSDITVGKPSKYVVELNAGIAEKLGIKEGSILKTTTKIPDAFE